MACGGIGDEDEGDGNGAEGPSEVGDAAEPTVDPLGHSPTAQCFDDELVGERQPFDDRANKNLLVVIGEKGLPR